MRRACTALALLLAFLHSLALAQVPGQTLSWEVTTDSAPEPIGSMVVSTNGMALASATWVPPNQTGNSQIVLWDMREGTALSLRGGPTGAVNEVALSRGGYWVAAARRDKTVALYSSELGGYERLLPTFGAEVTAVAFSDNYKWLGTGTANGEALLWSTKDWTVDKILRGPSSSHPIRDMAFVPGGAEVVAVLWTELYVGKVSGYRPAVFGFGLVPRNQKGHLIMDPASGKQTMVLEGGPWLQDPGPDPTAIVYSPLVRDGRDAIPSGDRDPIIRLFTFGKVRELRGHSGGINAVAFTPDGKRLASASNDRTVGVWATDKEAPALALLGHTAEVRGVGFGGDGRWLASAGLDGTTRIWDPATGKLHATLRSFPNDQWLVTTPEGVFDGTTDVIESAFANTQAGTKVPLSTLYATHHRPGLLKHLLTGEQVTAPPASTPTGLKVSLAQAALPAAKQSQAFANVRFEVGGPAVEVKLYRNGVAVRTFAKAPAKGPWSVSATVALAHGENTFLARARDAQGNWFGSPPMKVAGPQATVSRNAYLLLVAPGLPERKSGAEQARALGEVLKAALAAAGGFQKIVVVPLISADATRENVERTLATLAPQPAAPPRKSHPARAHTAPAAPGFLAELSAARPDDIVFLYFAVAGVSHGGRYYLLLEDEEVGAENAFTPPSSAMSDLDLLKGLQDVDSGRVVVVLDLMMHNAGDRRTPMESPALAQLARVKGAIVLVAAQGARAVRNRGRYLNLALRHVLEKGAPELGNPDAALSLEEWFRQSSLSVPEMQWRDMSAKGGMELAFVDGEENLPPEKRSHLRPRVFQFSGRDWGQLTVAKNPVKQRP